MNEEKLIKLLNKLKNDSVQNWQVYLRLDKYLKELVQDKDFDTFKKTLDTCLMYKHFNFRYRIISYWVVYDYSNEFKFLKFACILGLTDFVKYSIKCGIKINNRQQHDNILTAAVISKNKELIKYLIDEQKASIKNAIKGALTRNFKKECKFLNELDRWNSINKITNKKPINVNQLRMRKLQVGI